MNSCPFCGRSLRSILVDGKAGVQCADEVCLFNFQAQSCPECGGPPESVEHPQADTYKVSCRKGHEWVAR